MEKSPDMREPDDREPLRLSLENCPYEVLRDHLLDDALGSDPDDAWRMDLTVLCLKSIYKLNKVREIELTEDQEDAYWARIICARADKTVDERLGK